MKLNNQIKIEATVQFRDLAVGDAYEDEEGVICIKTSDQIEDTCYGRCIYYSGSKWHDEEESLGRYVKPIDATITLHGYKMEVRNNG